MAEAKFRVGDTVRFIGTGTIFTIREYNPATFEYRVQPGDDSAGGQWATDLYFELVKRAGSEAAND